MHTETLSRSASSSSSCSARQGGGGQPSTHSWLVARRRAQTTPAISSPTTLVAILHSHTASTLDPPPRMMDKLWDGLCAAEPFGAETMAVMAWTVCVCLLRALLFSIQVYSWVPNALVLANPFLMERFLRAFRNNISPFSSSLSSASKKTSNGVSRVSSTASSSSSSSSAFSSSSARTCVVPNLPVRIAESLLGRTPSILVLLPAHFLGGILGVTIVKLFLGLSGQALLPIMYGSSNGETSPMLLLGWWVFIKEILITALFVLGLLVLPELLVLNRLPRRYAYACLLPLLLVRLPDQTPAFAPATLFSLWFTSRDTLREVHGVTSIQYEHVFGPILGGFLAGVVMVACFPDDEVQ